MKKFIAVLLLLLVPMVANADYIASTTQDIECMMLDASDLSDVTTGTIYLIIQNSTGDADDGEYWNGSAWAAGVTNLSMSHDNDGVWDYAWSIPASLNGNIGLKCWESADVAIPRSGTINVQLEDRLITTDNIGINLDDTSGTIDAAEIGADAITEAKIADSAIAAEHIAADAIGASEIATDAIGAAEIASGAIAADEIAADAIGASEIATDAIGAAEIAADAITTAEIATDAIAADELAASALAEINTEVDTGLTDYDAVIPADLSTVANVVDEIDARRTLCDISASTSGTSFTVATCTDHDGSSITLATDSFVGSYFKAYTNGGSACNVVGEGVFVSDMTSGGVVTVKTADMEGSGYSATPSNTNCGVIAIP